MTSLPEKALLDVNKITSKQASDLCLIIAAGVQNLKKATIPERSKKTQMAEAFRQALRELISTQPVEGT